MYYEERQRFRQPWLWALMLPTMLGTAGSFAYGMFQQLVLKEPWGDRPASDTALIGIASGVTVLTLGILWLMAAAELRIEASDDALMIRFFPFLRRRIDYRDIRTAEARQYRPIVEYGGWGVRFGTHGKAYNVSGNRGVQLELRSGERLLLGSQKPESLAAAIQARMGSIRS